MLEKIENAIKDLLSCLQMARLYGVKHLEFSKSLDKAFLSLGEVLKEREELVIGLVEEELVFEKEILFELSKTVTPLISYLKGVGIERIAFYRKMHKDELLRFIFFLTTPKEEMKEEPQKYLLASGVKNIVVGKIKVPQVAPEAKEATARSRLGLYEDPLEKISRSLEGLLGGERFNLLSLKLTVSDLLGNIISGQPELLNLVTVKRYDNRVFVHLLDVSILAMYFSSKLGFSRDDVLDIGMAALFHDIGKLYIARKILNKPAKLNEDEFRKVKSHVSVGAEILLEYTDSIGILPAVVAFEHHVRYDLKGYPQLTFLTQPHIVSAIVSLCDVYDAISQRRSYKNDYPPDMIYDLMLKEKGRAFSPELLDKFFQVMGVWPMGTIVYLSDQRIAVVRKENEEDIFSPQVEVVFPADKKGLIDLKEKKGTLKIEYSLSPIGEGKGYLDLI